MTKFIALHFCSVDLNNPSKARNAWAILRIDPTSLFGLVLHDWIEDDPGRLRQKKYADMPQTRLIRISEHEMNRWQDMTEVHRAREARQGTR
jgi:hypothetical protein